MSRVAHLARLWVIRHGVEIQTDVRAVENIDGPDSPFHHLDLMVLPQDEQSKNCQQVGKKIWQDDTGRRFHRYSPDMWAVLRHPGEEYSEEMLIGLERCCFLAHQ